MSSSIDTLSPTMMPPVSSTALYAIPKSLRLIVSVAREPGPGVAPRVLADAAELEVERHRPGDALDRQVAGELVVACPSR